ncbi:N-acetylmuramoyl-L-alanine amidase [Nocardia fluminea]|uniref:N-acetylmuramoyl-L-alanine amidase n=1 Tax=Nocardia fluminea TaxID=134984 RepID=UPI001FE45642|nr:N-acetylmuramoyl-L-alanine amidase [Nocardia fluminea]
MTRCGHGGLVDEVWHGVEVRSRSFLPACLLAATALLAGCASTTEDATPATSTAAAVSSESAVPPTSPAVRRTVVLDPGHNGGNAAHLAQINAPVPDGRGGTKACNTTGTSAASGYPEHEFTWDVTVRVRDLLAASGVRVILTRSGDTGVGPCVDERAAIANQSGADAVVSIHADGNTGADAHGFHIAYADPPLNPVQAEAGRRLATALRDAMVAGGAVPSTYVGSAGLNPRADLAGLNLAERPSALVECGNMRSAADAALIETAEGRARYAELITAGIRAFLG